MATYSSASQPAVKVALLGDPAAPRALLVAAVRVVPGGAARARGRAAAGLPPPPRTRRAALSPFGPAPSRKGPPLAPHLAPALPRRARRTSLQPLSGRPAARQGMRRPLAPRP